MEKCKEYTFCGLVAFCCITSIIITAVMTLYIFFSYFNQNENCFFLCRNLSQNNLCLRSSMDGNNIISYIPLYEECEYYFYCIHSCFHDF